MTHGLTHLFIFLQKVVEISNSNMHRYVYGNILYVIPIFKNPIQVTITSDNVATIAEELTLLVTDDTRLDDQNLDNINGLLTSIVDVNDPSENVR